MKMAYSLAADAVVLLHLLFIVVAVFGGIVVLWVPQFAWLHVPALAWAVWIAATHGVCPLTPLENQLRRLAGEAGYPEGFIDHYLMPVIYPAGLTPAIQTWIAIVLAASNALLYGWALFKALR
jgi:hypothetical protein